MIPRLFISEDIDIFMMRSRDDIEDDADYYILRMPYRPKSIANGAFARADFDMLYIAIAQELFAKISG